VPYTVGTLLLPAKLVLIKALKQPQTYELVVWITLRIVTVLFGIATIFLVYLLGNKLFEPAAGALAALFVSVSFYHAMNSAVGTLDVPLSCLLSFQLWLACRVLKSARIFDYVLLGAASALLLGTKLAAAPFFLFPVLITFFDEPDKAALPVGRRLGLVLVYVFAAALFFSLLHPHLLLDPGKYIHWYTNEIYAWVDPRSRHLADIPWRFIHGTAIAAGWPLLPIALLGILTQLHPRRTYKLCLLACVAAYYWMFCWFLAPRYIIPIAPILCLFAAGFCISLIRHQRIYFRTAGIAAAGVIFIYSLVSCLLGLWIRFHDTRPLAIRYLAAALKPGTTVGFSSVSEKYPWSTHRWRYPWVDLKSVREVPLSQQPEVFIVTAEDIEQMAQALHSPHLLPGYQWDPAWDFTWYRHSPPSPALFRFYEAFLENNNPYVLDKVFEVAVPVPIELPPPQIRIYKKTGGGKLL